MEKLFKIFEEAGNAVRLIILASMLAALYLIYSATTHFAQSMSDFFKVTDVQNFSRTNLSAQENISELVTSQAQMDLYYFYKKDGSNNYLNTGETLSRLSGKKITLKDSNKRESYRQYCQLSLSLTLGYQDPYELADKIFNNSGDEDIYLPTILGKHITNRISAPTVPTVISQCQSEIEGENGEIKVKAWMQEDEILETHLHQGIKVFYQYLKYVAKNDPAKALVVDRWMKVAQGKVPGEVVAVSQRFSQLMEPLSLKSKQFPAVSALNYKVNSLMKQPIKSQEMFKRLQDDGFIESSVAMATRLPNLVLGTYVETYSTLAYSHVNDLHALVFKDNEYAIQRDVTSVTYGVEAVGKDPSIGNMESIVATAPQIIYRNTKKSEIGLFNDTNFENFSKRFGMSVDRYMAEQVMKSQESAIQNNSTQAKRAARRSFEYQLAELAAERGNEFSVRYLDLQPEPPSLYDAVLVKYLMSIGNQRSLTEE